MTKPDKTSANGRPADFLEHCWARLHAAAGERDNPWRTPALATTGNDGPEVRTVVLRAVHQDPFQLDFHTDRRSQKGALLKDHDPVAWMFYDGGIKEQLRCSGPVEVHLGDAAAREAWGQLPPASRLLYCQRPGPGKPLTGGTTLQDDSFGFANFLLVRCAVLKMDWLQIGREDTVRVQMRYRDGGWASQQVAP